MVSPRCAGGRERGKDYYDTAGYESVNCAHLTSPPGLYPCLTMLCYCNMCKGKGKSIARCVLVFIGFICWVEEPGIADLSHPMS